MIRVRSSISLSPQQVLLMRVARKVAGAWHKKGIRSITYTDLVNDAYEEAASAMSNKNLDHSRGEDSVEGYLFRCAFNRVGDRITRRICPVSTRSNGEVHIMGMTCKSTPLVDPGGRHHDGGRTGNEKANKYEDGNHRRPRMSFNTSQALLNALCIGSDSVENQVFASQVFSRMSLIADECGPTTGPAALQVVLGLTTVKQLSNGDKLRAKALYQSVRQLKHKLVNDYTLYKMAADGS